MSTNVLTHLRKTREKKLHNHDQIYRKCFLHQSLHFTRLSNCSIHFAIFSSLLFNHDAKKRNFSMLFLLRFKWRHQQIVQCSMSTYQKHTQSIGFYKTRVSNTLEKLMIRLSRRSQKFSYFLLTWIFVIKKSLLTFQKMSTTKTRQILVIFLILSYSFNLSLW